LASAATAAPGAGKPTGDIQQPSIPENLVATAVPSSQLDLQLVAGASGERPLELPPYSKHGP
jgi:hypothetical protein